MVKSPREVMGDEASSKTLVNKLFGPTLGEKLALAAGHGKRKDYRGVLEPTGAVTQCERAGHPFVPNMPCYLCGQPIPDKALLSGTDDELYPECEHIFPVTEARWFLDLYMTTRPPTDPWTQRAIELEYDQSHRVCNQAKSNFSFIKEDPVTKNPLVNRVGIQKVLKSIQIRAQKHVGDYRNNQLETIMKSIASSILTRTNVIEARIQEIINHIQSVEGLRNPNYQNMVLLLRTALVADPSAMTPSLKAIHDTWYSNTEEVKSYKERMFEAFVDDTYKAYPSLRPENIGKLFEGGLLNADAILTVTSPTEIRRILRAYFDSIQTPDPYGKTLLSAVYYGIYKRTLEIMLRSQISQEFIPNLCTIYARASVIQTNEPATVKALGDLPTLSTSLKTRCEVFMRNEERAYRTRARDLNLLPDIDDEPATPDEDATYYLNGLREQIEATLKQSGFSQQDATDIGSYIESNAKNVFIETHPEGIARAKQETADQVSSALFLVLTKFQRSDLANTLPAQVFEFILKNREDETKTYEGGNQRRPLYGTISSQRRHRRSSRRMKKTRRRIQQRKQMNS